MEPLTSDKPPTETHRMFVESQCSNLHPRLPVRYSLDREDLLQVGWQALLFLSKRYRDDPPEGVENFRQFACVAFKRRVIQMLSGDYKEFSRKTYQPRQVGLFFSQFTYADGEPMAPDDIGEVRMNGIDTRTVFDVLDEVPLTREERQFVVCRYVEEMSLEETAELMGYTRRHFCIQQISKSAREKIKEALSD